MRNRLITLILRVFFRLLYHDMAWSYDWVAWTVSAGLWSQWVRQVIPYARGPVILELGHGPGHLQTEFIHKGYRTIGMDASRQMGRLAYRRIHHNSKNKNPLHNGYAHLPDLLTGQAQAIPFPSGSVDTVVATFPTEYIFDPSSLDEIYRVLAPGGRLAILFTGWITGTRLHERAAAALFRVTGQSGEWYPEWAQAFERCGFQVDSRWIQLQSSRVLILLGQKPDGG